ncbi:hypothetical protein E2C01_017258 [Portunus trituberculatus]|uniref:Uncharacterized protein n=1 Tax=Portunus trituberculatus TaxID=210409 RepID=A0A5B7DT55_PORTR|nr:hypothetical protein [Portunus trituberculatus]
MQSWSPARSSSSIPSPTSSEFSLLPFLHPIYAELSPDHYLHSLITHTLTLPWVAATITVTPVPLAISLTLLSASTPSPFILPLYFP